LGDLRRARAPSPQIRRIATSPKHPMTTPVDYLRRLSTSGSLSEGEAHDLFEQIMTGRVEPLILAAMLGAMAASPRA
jgi:hypothetical protein